MPESSPETEVVDTLTEPTITPATETSAATDQTDVKAADSSPADKAEPTMLDAVKTALKQKEESPASQTPGDKAETPSPDSKTKSETEEDGDKPFTEDELKGLHAKTRKRFQKLTSRLEAADAEIGALKPKAERFDRLTAFIRDNGMTDAEANGALNLVAMLRNDPKGAREKLQPVMAELDRILGESPLPPDLQQRVQAGYLTEDDARALMRAHASSTLNQQRLEQTQEREKSERELRELRAQTDATIGTIEDWEAKKAEKDPDWHLKRTEIADQVELAIERKSRELKRPWFPSSQEAIQLSEDALKRINERNKRFAPKPTEIRPVDGGASPRTSAAAPKTMLEVVRQAVGAA
jgi:hypothetical protein